MPDNSLYKVNLTEKLTAFSRIIWKNVLKLYDEGGAAWAGTRGGNRGASGRRAVMPPNPCGVEVTAIEDQRNRKLLHTILIHINN
jgi:hypothetical protein